MALKIVVSRGEQPISEHIFGKEARARGVAVGSADDNDICLEGLPPHHGKVEKSAKGYQYRDVGSGTGFTSQEGKYATGATCQVTDGTKLSVGDFTLLFTRGEAAPRSKSSATAIIDLASRGGLPGTALKAMSELSTHFLGEGTFENDAELKRFQELLRLTLEVAMEWMGRVLKGREEFKDQFSAPLTQLFARSLNPLKKGTDITHIANFLLDWREEREIEGIRGSLQHAFMDMAKHQMGLLAGVQNFISELQQKLDPVKIEKEAGGGLFGNKKAWERYTQLYGETFAESGKLFNELIYPSIRKGYIFSHDELAP